MPMNTTTNTWITNSTSTMNGNNTLFTTTLYSPPTNHSQTNESTSMSISSTTSQTPTNTSQTNPNGSNLTTTNPWVSSNTSQTTNNVSISSSTSPLITNTNSPLPMNTSRTTNNVSTITISSSTTTLQTSTQTGSIVDTTSINRTTSSPSSPISYVCNRIPNECGCSLNDVIVMNGNENIYPQSWSMIVSIRENGVRHLCSGTILSDLYILTSARCVSNRLTNTNLSVVAGLDDLWGNASIIHSVNQIIIHENYSPNVTSLHDIALLKLSQSLIINRSPLFSLSKICLPKSSSLDQMQNKRLMTVGWKNVSFNGSGSNLLQQIPVNMIINSNSLCFDSNYTNNYQFCAGLTTKSQGKTRMNHHLSR